MIEPQLTKSLRAFQEKIHATGDKVTEDWTSDKVEDNMFSCPFFQGEKAFLECLNDIVGWWEPITMEMATEVQTIMNHALELQ
jgi:hypothetical protein